MLEWLSFEWFRLPTLQGFVWAEPLYLYGLFSIPFLFFIRWLFYNRTSQRLGLSVTKRYSKTNWTSHFRHIIPIIFSLGLVCIFIALARPQRVSESKNQYSEGIDIMLALDISDSMLEKDLTPNRLSAAKEVARNFINGRFQDRIGLVVFAGEAFSLCPLTTDYDLLNNYIDEISSTMIPMAGTAIGSALATCINRLRDVDSKSKVTILISDGSNTAGQLDPVTAADLAKSFNIKLYTVAVGKNLKGGDLDESALRAIAKQGNGQFFRATDNTTLSAIFSQINALEKVVIKDNIQREVEDYYYIYLNWALVFILLSFILKNTFLGNILED